MNEDVKSTFADLIGLTIFQAESFLSSKLMEWDGNRILFIRATSSNGVRLLVIRNYSSYRLNVDVDKDSKILEITVFFMPAIPIMSLLDCLGIWTTLEPAKIIILYVIMSIITWISVGILSAFFGWWILALWAVIIFFMTSY